MPEAEVVEQTRTATNLLALVARAAEGTGEIFRMVRRERRIRAVVAAERQTRPITNMAGTADRVS